MPANSTAPKFKNVFVLCTGRSGSVTFVKACNHFTNYTAGHETLSCAIGDDRLNYPPNHIEVDNRLSWLLGRLEQRFGDAPLYVHLKNDPARVAASYDKRWDHKNSLITGYNRSILMQDTYSRHSAFDMVETITANIDAFLANKTNVIEIDIRDPEVAFRRFASLVGAEGDVDAAVAEFKLHYNSSDDAKPVSTKNHLMHPQDLLDAHEALKADYAQMKSDLETDQERMKAEAERKHFNQDLVIKEQKKTLKRQIRKYKKFKKWAIPLALPTLILLAPLWVPAAAIYGLRRRSKRKAGSASPKAQTFRLPVHEAFQKRIEVGPEAALAILQRNEQQIPPGTIELFRAIDARTDEDWLALMNVWAASYDVPTLELEPGPGPRFHRIRFAEVASVEAPDLITIIIPCYNAASTVRLAVQSILDQSWRNIEVIVVNDASPDETGAVLDLMATEDRRVRVLHNSVNVGPYVSKNRALRLARGTYVTGHDSDDIALPDRLAEQMKSFKSNPDAKAAISYMVRLTEDGGFTSPVTTLERTYDGVARLCPISMVCETETLRDAFGGWDSVRFGADSELIERMTLGLPDGLVRTNHISMLCLSAAGSLTNDPETGGIGHIGVSPVRRKYKNAYRNWHKTFSTSTVQMPFPHDPRKFEVPEKMRVPAEDVRRLIADD